MPRETLEIACDVARRLLEASTERGEPVEALPISDHFEMPLVVGGLLPDTGEMVLDQIDQRMLLCPEGRSQHLPLLHKQLLGLLRLQAGNKISVEASQHVQ